MTPQPDTKDPQQKARMKDKLAKVHRKGYIGPAEIKALTSFFGVQKGMFDIRLVYDGTKSGLNDAVWVPSFWLPTVYTLLRRVNFCTWMSDLDFGEMFLNFMLHLSLRPYAGIDLTKFFAEDAINGVTHEAWNGAGMGFKWSPYQAVQGAMVLDEVIGGDRHNPKNVFRWDKIRLNLPRDDTPTLP